MITRKAMRLFSGAAVAGALAAGNARAADEGQASQQPTQIAQIETSVAPEGALVEALTVSAPSVKHGPSVSLSGVGQYVVSAQDLAKLPAGSNTALTDVLAQMPGVAIDQNQQIHIRDTEGPQFQYQINGVMAPFDINTNPPFLSMINPQFIKQADLLVGVLPSRYSYATGGVVDIHTKDGCEAPGGSVTLYGGQRGLIQPSAEYGGCAGRFSYYVSGLYSESDNAFSSATPGPNPIHDHTDQGQGFGFFSYALDPTTKLSLALSGATSDNQLPNVAGLAPQFTLAGAAAPPSSAINSYLDFRDALAILALRGDPTSSFSYQIAYTAHFISEAFRPDKVGELTYQGVASTATHFDTDNIVQADVTWTHGAHTLGAGVYFGAYDVTADDTSLVFPVDPVTQAVGTSPVTVVNNAHKLNVASGVYVDDLWRVSQRLRINFGLRGDRLTGFSQGEQLDPTLNLAYDLASGATVHAGFARYMQVPSFQGIAPTAQAAFANTTAAGPPGVATPKVEDDDEWDVGVVTRLNRRLTLSLDNYYEVTHHYLDTGQFGVVPIFAPFNYGHGYIWGSELAVNYKSHALSAYANLTVGRNMQEGVATGQFNFDPDELAYINSHYIVLDHQPLYGASGGASYDWRAYSFSIDAIYSSGLRAGFADLERLPSVVQVNLSAERSFQVPGIGKVTNRLVVLNAFDRTNLIRPAEGIGIFQAAYGPRFTIEDALSIRF